MKRRILVLVETEGDFRPTIARLWKCWLRAFRARVVDHRETTAESLGELADTKPEPARGIPSGDQEQDR